MATLLDRKKEYASGVMAPQHICVFGDPFTGKTQLIGELAEKFHLIYFDLDNGLSTLMKLPDEYLDNITYIKVKDGIDAPRAHSTIDKIVYGGEFLICEEHGTVNCRFCKPATYIRVSIPKTVSPEGLKTIVVIDSASQLTNSVAASILVLNKVTVDTEKLPFKEGFDEWGAQWKFLNKIFATIQTAPFHIIITAHCEETKNEQGTKQLTPSIGTNNYSSKSGRFFDSVVYCGKSSNKHVFMSNTTDSAFIQCGSRLGIDIKNMVTPSLIPFFDGSKPEMIDKNKAATIGGATNKEAASKVLSGLTKPTLKLPGSK